MNVRIIHRILLLTVSFLLAGYHADAQRLSVGTNLAGYMEFGTMNADLSLAVGRHLTIDAKGRYNPWTYNEEEPDQFQHRSMTGAAGIRFWPWHVFSGWWLGMSAQYSLYNRGGLITTTSEEGEAFGMGLGAGYALMLTGWLNLDFGLGIWGGKKDYVTYECPSCGRIIDEGNSWFLAPDDLRIALTIIF